MRYEFKNFAFLRDDSVWAAEATFCAADQGQFWPYHDTLWENANPYTKGDLKRFAKELGLDSVSFDACLDDGSHSQEVADLLEEGRAKGVTSTPTILVNDTVITGAQPYETFQQAIAQELAKAGQ